MDKKDNQQTLRLRRVAELVLTRLEQMLEGEGSGELDSQELKRIVSTLKDIRELQELPGEGKEEKAMPLFTVKLEGELEAFGE